MVSAKALTQLEPENVASLERSEANQGPRIEALIGSLLEGNRSDLNTLMHLHGGQVKMIRSQKQCRIQ